MYVQLQEAKMLIDIPKINHEWAHVAMPTMFEYIIILLHHVVTYASK